MKNVKNNYKEFKKIVKSFDISKLYEIQTYLLKSKGFFSILDSIIKDTEKGINSNYLVDEDKNVIYKRFYDNVIFNYNEFKNNVFSDSNSDLVSDSIID